MTLLTNYQESILKSLKKYDFQRILRMIGRCHDALIGEWINWWFGRQVTVMICNPARGSKSKSCRYFADLLFLENFKGEEFYRTKGVAEVENSEEKFLDKIKSLRSYENCAKLGSKIYPDLEFAVFCHTLKLPNDESAEKIYDDTLKASEESNLLWIVCEIGKSPFGEKAPNYSIYKPHHVRGYDYFYYKKNFSSVSLYGIKNGKEVQNITVAGIEKNSG